MEGDAGRLPERDRGPRPPFRGGRRGGYGNGEAGGDSERPPRRMYERRSGTGRGYEMKREGAGRANWGTATDDVIAQLRLVLFNVFSFSFVYLCNRNDACQFAYGRQYMIG